MKTTTFSRFYALTGLILVLLAAPHLLYAATDVTISAAGTTGMTYAAGVYTPTGTPATANISSSELVGHLNGTDGAITINTASGGANTGTLTVSAPITWNSANGLTLKAQSSLTTSNNIYNLGSGSITLLAAQGVAGDMSIGGYLTTANGAITLYAGVNSGGDLNIVSDIKTTAALTISSGGADITMKNSSTGGRVLFTEGAGICFAAATTIDAGGGNIILNGTGGNASSNRSTGVWLWSSTTVQTTGAGAITISGKGLSGTGMSEGILFDFSTYDIHTGNGAININATSATSGASDVAAIDFFNNGTTSIYSTAGAITVNANTRNASYSPFNLMTGHKLYLGHNNGSTITTGDITVYGDLTSAAQPLFNQVGTVTIKGKGNLLIGSSSTVGTGTSGFSIPSGMLSGGSWKKISLGDVRTGSLTISDNLTNVAAGDSINITSKANITLNNAVTNNASGKPVSIFGAQGATGILSVNYPITTQGGEIRILSGVTSASGTFANVKATTVNSTSLVGTGATYYGTVGINAAITSNGANIAIANSPYGNYSSYYEGIALYAGTAINPGSGSIAVAGYATGQNGSYNIPVALYAGSNLQAAGSGTINVMGLSSGNGSTLNTGIYTSGTGTANVISENGDITMSAKTTGTSGSWFATFGEYDANAKFNIYATGSGKITLSANSTNVTPFYFPATTNIGWNGSSSVTTGDVSITGSGGTSNFNGMALKSNGGAVTIGDNGAALGAVSLPSGSIVSAGSYKSFTIGGTKTAGVTLSTPLTTNAASTAGILVTSSANITVNNPLNTAAASSVPISLLAAQGVAGGLKVGGNVVTNGGKITLYQGRNAAGADLAYGGNSFAGAIETAAGVQLLSNGGDIDIQNTQTAAVNTVRGMYFGASNIIDARGTSAGGNITMKGLGAGGQQGIEASAGYFSVKTNRTGTINMVGTVPSGNAAGLLLYGAYNDSICTENGDINITTSSPGYPAIAVSNTSTTKIYSTAGNINISAISAYSPVSMTSPWGNGTAFYIGTDNNTTTTTGNINITMSGGSPSFFNTYLKTLGGTVGVIDNGTALGSMTIPSGMFVTSGNYKSITLGGTKTAGVIVSTPLTTNAASTAGVLVTSTADITINNPLNTAAASGAPISLLAAQGAAGTGTLTTAAAGTLTTNNGLINLRSGVNANGSVVSTAAGHITVNGPVSMGAIGSQPIDWQASGNLTLNASLDASFTNNIPISLTSNKAVNGIMTFSAGNNLKTAGGAVALLAGTSTIKGTILADGGISTAGGNITIQNTVAGSDGSREGGVTIGAGGLSSDAGNITLSGWGGSGAWMEGVYMYNNGAIQTTTGTITINGKGGVGSSSSVGVLLCNSYDVKSTSGNITLNGEGNASGTRKDGIWFYANGGGNKKIYSTSGNITLYGKAPVGDQCLLTDYYGSGEMAAYVYIGSPDGILSGTTGDISILGESGTGGGMLIWQSAGSHGVFDVKGTGKLAIQNNPTSPVGNGGFSLYSGSLCNSVWKNVTLGDNYTSGVTVSDNITTSATSTTGVSIISKTNINLNNPINTSAKAAMPITILAAQGAAGTLTTATTGTLTTDHGIINLRSGVNADASTAYNVAGHAVINGLVNYTSAPLAIDWRTAGNMAINTPLNTSAVAGLPITLLGGQKSSAGGKVIINGNLITQNADITLYGGLDATGTETGVTGCVGLVTGAIVNAGTGNILMKNTSLGSPIPEVSYTDRAGIQLNLINTTTFSAGYTMAASGVSTLIGKDITLNGTGIQNANESRGIDDGGSLISASGNISLTGVSGALANTSGDGIRFVTDGGPITHTIKTTGATSTITLNANGKSSSYGGITLWSNQVNTVNIYNANGTGAITINATCANTANGRPFYDERVATGTTNVNIGWDGTTNAANITNGDIIMKLTGGANQYFSATPRTFFKTNGGNVSIIDDGTNALGAITLQAGQAKTDGSFKSFTIGGLKTTGVTINDNLTTNAVGTAGILVTSKSDITTYGALSTYNNATAPITILGGQGATGDVRIYGGSLTTNGANIKVYSGLFADGSETTFTGTMRTENTSTITSNGGDIFIRNSSKGAAGVLDKLGTITGGIINAEGASKGGNITIAGYGKLSSDYCDGIYLNGTVKTNFSGTINMTGVAGAGSTRSIGIYMAEWYNLDVHTASGDITMTATGGPTTGGWREGFMISRNNSTGMIYSTSGNINLICPSANDRGFTGYGSQTGSGTLYIGYNGNASSLGTTGNISLMANYVSPNAGQPFLYNDGATIAIKGQGELYMGSNPTLPNNVIPFGGTTTLGNTILGTAWKKITIGDNLFGGLTVNDNLTLSAAATGNIRLVSNADITVNNPLNASASAGKTITILAAQGAAGTGTLLTNSGGTLTTDNAAITLRSGVSEDNATISTAAAHITVNGAINMGVNGAWPIDWRSSANMTINTALNTSVTAAKPVSLTAALGTNGLLTENNDITTAGGDVTITSGTATAKGSISLVSTCDILTNGGNVTVQNAAAGGYTGTYDIGVYSAGTINAGAGNIVLTGTGATGGGASDGVLIDNTNMETTTGTITLNGFGGSGSSRSDGVLFGGTADKRVHTVSGDITINGTSATTGSRPDAIWFWSGTTNRVYSTSGNISMVGKAQSTADGHCVLAGYNTSSGWTNCTTYIGYDGGTGPGTTGNISITGDTKNAGCLLIHNNGTLSNFIIRGQKDLTMQSIQTNTVGNGGFVNPNGIVNGMVSTGNWRNITIGDKYTGTISSNDNLATNAASTTGISIISKADITLNNTVSTAAKAAMPITILAAQGAAGTGTLTTATAGTLTTNGGAILLRSGVNADASVVSTAAGDVTVNGAVTTGATALPFDWRASRTLRLNTDLSTLATAAMPISLYAGQGIIGDLDLNGNLSTQNGVVKVYGGLLDDTTPSGFGSTLMFEANKTITTNGGDVMIKNSTNGGGVIDTYGRGLLTWGNINAKGTSAGGNITIYGKSKATGAYLEGIYLNGTIETNFAGKVDITGIGGVGSNRSEGLYVGEGGNTNIITQNGDITLTGTGGNSMSAGAGDGIKFQASTNKIYSAAGNINLITTSTPHTGVYIAGGTNYIGYDGTTNGTTGNITIKGSGANYLLNVNSGSFAVKGSGNLSIISNGATNVQGVNFNSIIQGTAWKKITLGDAFTGPITCNDALVSSDSIKIATTGEFGGSGNINSNGSPISISTLTTTASPTYTGQITGAGSLTKLGTGLLVLTNTGHNFTGKTILTAGELRLNPGGNATWASPMELNGGTLGTANMGGYTFTSSGTLNLTAGSTLALGTSNHTLIFANSSGLTWAPSQYLNVTGWQTSLGASGTQGKLKFALAPLTATQLSQFKFNQSNTFYPGGTIAANEVVPLGYQAVFVSAQTGNWNVPTTWGLQGAAAAGVTYPGPASKVVIAANHNVTLVANTATSDSLSFAANGTLTMGTYTMGAGSLSGTNAGATISMGTGSFTLTNTNASSFAGIISGTGTGVTFTKAGVGSLTLSGANTYSGNTTISAGNMAIAGAGKLGGGTYAGNISVVSGYAFKYNSTATQTFSGIISGAGAFAKDSISTLTLSGANTYTGATTVTAGTLKLSSTNTSPSYAIASGAVLEEYCAVDKDHATSPTSYTGAGTFRKTGAGNLLWGGVGTFAFSTGALIDVQAGKFTGGCNANDVWTSNMSDLNIASGAIFNAVEAQVIVDKLTGSGTLGIGCSGWTGQLRMGANNGTSTFDGVIQNTDAGAGNVGYLIKNGTGTLTLTGVNTYTGTTAINGGVLAISGAGSLNSGAYANTIAIATGDTLKFNSTAAQTLSGVISGAGALQKNNTGTLTLSAVNTFTGGVTINGGKIMTTVQYCLANNAANAVVINNGGTLSGAYSDMFGIHTTSVVTPVTINAGGKLTNEGAWYSVLGPLTLNGGELSYIAGHSVYKSWALIGGVNVTDNSIMSGTGTNGSIMLGSCAVTNANFNIAAGKTLTLSATSILNGLNSSAVAQASSMTKTGAGSIIFTGTASHTGTTTLTAGELRLNPTSSTTWTSPMILNGGTLSTVGIGAYNIVSNSTLQLTDNSVINFDPSTAHTLTFANSNAVAWTSTKTLLVNGWQGSLGVTGTKAKVNFNTATLTAMQLSMITFNYNSGFYSCNYINSNPYELVPNVATSSPYFVSVQTGYWNDPLTWGRTGVPTAGVNYPGSGSRVTIAGNHNVTLLTNSAISDSLKFTANGTLTMGTYTMAASSLTGTNAGATISMGSGSSFTLTNTNASAFAGAITGTGATFTKAGTGSLTLSGANTYTGNTTISAGNVEIAGAGVLGGGNYPGAISVPSGYTLKFNSTATQIVSGIVSGAGALIKDNTGTVTLSGANTLTGATTVTAGNLVWSGMTTGSNNGNVAGGYQMTTPGLSVASGATFTVGNGANDFSSSNIGLTITGAGTIVKNGTGKWWLPTSSGTVINMSKGGLIDIQAGWIRNDNGNTVWTSNLGSMNIATGATMDLRNNDVFVDALTGSGTVDNNYTAAKTIVVGIANGSSTFSGAMTSTGGALYLMKNGTGTLTLTGVNTYTGTTIINGGVLAVSGAGSLGAGSYGNTISIAAGDTLKFNSTAAQTLSNVISGAGALVKNNTGTLTLSASNSYTGGTTVNGGQINAAASYMFANNASNKITINNGGTINCMNHWVFFDWNNTLLTPIVINAGGKLTNGGAYINSIGSLTLNGGTLDATGGYDAIRRSWNLQNDVIVTDNSVIQGSGANYGIELGSNGVTTGTNFNIAAGKTLSITAPIYNRTDGTNSLTSYLTKTGAGTLILSSANTYSGATNINSGTIQSYNALALGTNSPVVFANDASAILDLAGSNLTVGSLSGGGAAGGKVTSSGIGAMTLTMGGDNATKTFSGVIENGSATSTGVAIIKNGSGVQSFDGTNTYTGTNTVNAGTLQMGTGGTTGTIGAGVTDVILASGATFSVNQSDPVTVTNRITGTGGIFTQAGTGITTLKAANTYTGATNINAGTLQIGDGSNATATAGTGALAVNGNTLKINLNGTTTLGNSTVTSTGQIQNIGTGKVTFANGSVSNVDGGAAGLVLSNLIASNLGLGGDVTLGCNNNSLVAVGGAGTTIHVVNAGSFWWMGGTSATNAPNIDIASGVTVSQNGSQTQTLYYNNLTGAGNFTMAGNGVYSYVLGNSTMTGTLTVNQPMYFGAGGTAGTTISSPIVNNNTVNFNSTTDCTFSGTMTGGGAVDKYNTNTLKFTNPTLAYTGITWLLGGTLKLNPTATTATLASRMIMYGGTLSTVGITTGTTITSSSTLNVTDNSTLDLEPTGTHNLKFANSSGDTWTANKILTVKGWQGAYTGTTGTDAKFYVGTAAGQFSAAQVAQTKFYNGTNYYAASQLATGEAVAGAAVYATGFISVATGDWNAPATWGYSGAAVAGTTYPGATDNATVSSGHTVTLKAASTAAAVTVTGTLNMGLYNMTVGNLNGAGNVALGADTLTLGDATIAANFSGVISGSGVVIKVGTGTQKLSGGSTYTGGTTVNAGKLILARDAYPLANNANNVMTINNGGTVSAGANWALGWLSPVVINAGGTLTTEGNFISSIGPLTLNGGTITNTSGGFDGNWHNWLLQGTVQVTDNSTINGVGGNSGINLGLSNNYNNNQDNFVGFNIVSGKTLTINASLYNRFNGGGIAGPLAKTGAGTLILNGANYYTGATSVSQGLMQMTSTNNSPSYDIASGAVLESNIASGNIAWAGATMSGAGTFRKTGAGVFNVNDGTTWNWNMASGALIDIQAGQFNMAGNFTKYWTNNHADLNVATGATAYFQEDNVFVNNLTGGGTIQTGYNSSYNGFTVGVDGGSSTFDGVIANTTTGTHNGALVKVGTGTLTLTNPANTYTGTTTLTAGTLKLNPSATTATWATSKVIFNGGTLSTSGIATGTTMTCAGTILLNNNSTLDFDNTAATHTLKFANSTAEAWTAGKFLTITDWSGAYNTTTGTRGHLVVGTGTTVTTSLTAAQLLQTRFSDGTLLYNTAMIATAEAVPSATAFATNFVSVATGAWNVPATWGYTGTATAGVNYPGASDKATVSTGNTVTLAADVTTTGALTCNGTLMVGDYGLTVGSLTGSGTITLGTLAALNVGSDATSTTFSGTINGTGLFNKTGAGTLTLSGTNTYSGFTFVQGGTLKAGSTSAFGNQSDVTVATGATLDLNGSANSIGSLAGAGNVIASGAFTFGDNTNTTFSGVISGGSALTKNGTGTQTLTGLNTYTGTTTVGAGTLTIGGAGTLNAGTYSNSIAIASGATFTYNSTVDQILSGVISGAGTLNKNNTNTLTLSNNNTLTGNVNVNAGILIGNGSNTTNSALGTAALITVNNGATLKSGATINGLIGYSSTAGTIQLNAGGTLDANVSTTTNHLKNVIMAGGTLTGTAALSVDAITYGRWCLDGTLTVVAGTNTTSTISATGFFVNTTGAQFVVNASGASNGVDLLVSGTLYRPASYADGGVMKSGAGTMVLTGANTYTGATIINAGTVKAGSATAIGVGSALSFANDATAILDMNGNSLSVSSLAGGGILGGKVTNSQQFLAPTLTVGSSNGNTTFSGIIQDGSANVVSLTKVGTGTLTLDGANTYSGATLISAGTLQVGSGGVNGVLGTSAVTNNSALIFNRGNNATFANLIGGTGTLAQSGAGMLSLTGVNSYTGNTTINSGTLEIAGNGQLGGGAYGGTIAVASGSTLSYNSSSAQTLSGIISGSGRVIKDNSGTLTLSAANTYIGGTTINGGTLVAAKDPLTFANNASNTVTVNSGGTLSAGNNNVFGNIGTNVVTPLVINGGTLTTNNNWTSELGPLTIEGGTITNTVGGWDVSYHSWMLHDVTVNDDATINAVGTNAGINVGANTPAGTTFNIASGKTLTINAPVYNGLNSGGTAVASYLTKTGTGTLVLGGANAYTGLSTISAGTVKLGTSTSLGTTAANTTVASGAVLDLNGTSYSSAEALNLNGTGILSGGAIINSSSTAASFAGLITLGSASSVIANNGITLTGNVTNGGVGLELGGTSTASALSGVISGTGGVTKNGAGTWKFSNSANQTYTGTTTVNAGELRLNPAATGTTFASKIVLNGGTLSTTGITSGRTWTSTGALSVTDNSNIALDPTNLHTLTFATSNAETWGAGKQLNITGWQGVNGTTGTVGKVLVGNSITTLGSSNLSNTQFTLAGGVALKSIQLATGELVPAIIPIISYTTPNVYMKNTAITSLTPTVTAGAPITGYTVNKALPAGLALNATTGAISGTPTAITALDTYRITATNSNGTGFFDVVITVNNSTFAVTFAAPDNGTLTVMNGATAVTSGDLIQDGTVLTVTATPNVGYALNTLVANTVPVVSNSVTVSAATAIAATFAIPTWTGATDTDWNTATNWTPNLVPTATMDVIVPATSNAPFVSDNSLCRNLTINTGAVVTIPAAKSLTVSGTITNNAGVTGLVMKSDVVLANGTLIFNNAQNAPVQATVEMFSKASWNMSNPVQNRYKWQFFGVPVRTVAASPLFDGAIVRQYDETKAVTNWTAQTAASNLLPFNGYEICQLAAKTYTLTGELVNADLSTTLTKTTGAATPGSQVVSNPYTAAIDITKLTFGSQAEATVYLYNTGTVTDWATYSGSTTGANPGQYTSAPTSTAGVGGIPGQIPSMQGFVVNAMSSDPNATFGIPYSAVVTKNTDVQRVRFSVSNTSDFVYSIIDVVGAHGGDRMWLFTNSGCTHSFDNSWDGYKMFGSALVPQIFAKEADGNYQVDAVNDVNNTDLGFQAGTDTDYTLRFTHTNTQSVYTKLYLLDNVTGGFTDITASGTEYAFTAQTSSTPATRFKLMTSTGNVTDNNVVDANQLKVYSSQKTIFAQNMSKENGDLMVYDVAGRFVAKLPFKAMSSTATPTKLVRGVYIVTAVINNQKVLTNSLIIE